MNDEGQDVFRVPTDADRTRLDALWRAIAGPGHHEISPQNRMDVWFLEQRMKADRDAEDRLVAGTWVLVLATLGLVIASACEVVVVLVK
jgi:hypothetical protein